MKKYNTKTMLGHIRDLIIIVIIGDAISYFFNPSLEIFLRYFWLTSFYCLIIGGTLWKGNQFVSYLIYKRIDIYKEPLRSLVWNLTMMFVFTIVDIIVVNYLWWVVFYDHEVEFLFNRGFLILLIQLIVTIVITSIFYSISFFKAWREAAVNEERYKKESIHYQYKALKNQVNPHFLFNSLNSLTQLVNTDQKQAVKFIKQLSEVYRYVLEHKDNELVLLSEELDFVNNYIFLQKIRHDANLWVDIKIDGHMTSKVVPMSIQILVENAIKHNEVSGEKPLWIQITNDEDYIIVENNLQRRMVIQNSDGIGLSAIKRQYERLTDKTVIHIENDIKFIIKIPFIETNTK
jgi:sensor histidine kinase YesM